MDASTFINSRLTDQRFRDLDREVSLRRSIAEHRAARRAEGSSRVIERRERRSSLDVALPAHAA